MNEVIFPDIDTSYWLVDDKTWMEKRKTQWVTIEPRLLNDMHKPKKAMPIIKRYFLKGSMPDFSKIAEWKGGYAHLDLLCFIWLHPSRDRAVLKSLRDAYIQSPLVGEREAWQGIGGLLAAGEITAQYEWSKGDEKGPANCMYTGENELLFDILIGDLSKQVYPETGGSGWSIEKLRGTYRGLFDMSRWLCHKHLNYINEDCLFQYDNYLAYWYLSCAQIKDSDEQAKRKALEDVMLFPLGLYRIHNFDTEKEGDTCRTRFVHKIRKILDEREFIVEVKDMWESVKAGEINPETPWEN